MEDEDALRMALAELVSDWGYTVFTAANGIEAIELLTQKAGGIDLVISDFVMVQIGGAALLAYIHTKYPLLPVIFMTGHANEDNLAHYEALGIRDWLHKPLDTADFAAVVDRYLRVP
ncbi:MAG: response regulator [Caldilineaceae bacterium]|nr:response regulator [Caldilineaceae bacterium]